MNESMLKYMKPGLIHFMAFPETIKGEGPVMETLKQIAQDTYFQAVEITWIKDPSVRAQAKNLLDTAGMTIAYGAQPRLLTTGLNINDTDEEGRGKALRTLKEGIDEAYEMGAVGFAFLSGRYDAGNREGAFRALVKSTDELCAYARSKGDMRVVLEIFDFDVDKKSLIGPADLAKRFAEEVCSRNDNFGLMVDLSHLPLIRETAEEAILPIKDYIVHAHLGNCVTDPDLPCFGDAHPRFLCPGGRNGVAEIAEFLRVLMGIGFLNESKRPIVSFEVKPFGDESPDMVIANAKRLLDEAWAIL